MQGFSHSTPQSREQRGPGITRVLGGSARQRRLGHDKEDSSTVTLQSALVGMWASQQTLEHAVSNTGGTSPKTLRPLSWPQGPWESPRQCLCGARRQAVRKGGAASPGAQ